MAELEFCFVPLSARLALSQTPSLDQIPRVEKVQSLHLLRCSQTGQLGKTVRLK